MSPLSYCIHSTQYFLSQENLDWSLYNGLEDIFGMNLCKQDESGPLLYVIGLWFQEKRKW